jgi:hypothetical protein
MSKRINVNPDHYKVAGRERPGDGVRREPKQRADKAKEQERWQRIQQTKKKTARGVRNL